jgi:2-hydroxychromene-2-carboxylate isomerase
MQGAYFVGAHLQGAYLERADLSDADLTDAVLKQADLSGASLSAATFTQEQLEETTGDENTVLPSYLKRPAHWGGSPTNRSRETEPHSRTTMRRHCLSRPTLG